MAAAGDPYIYSYPWPLTGYENGPELDNTIQEDKSYRNPPADKSEAYTHFVSPLDNGRRGGFDVHIYFHVANEKQTKFATALWERIRREFPELRIYKVFDRPIGPHTMAMFEVNLFTPAQFGAFIPWLVINRGPLSALVHPNTEDETWADAERNHTQRAIWMGQPVPLFTQMFKEMDKKAN